MSTLIQQPKFGHLNHLINEIDLPALNRELEVMSAEDRVRLLLRYFPQTVVTSSFGVQAAVTLHLVNSIKPGIPVLFIDTQYHFPETLSYVEELKFKLKLNVKVFKNAMPKEEQERLFGKLWEQGAAGNIRYGLLNKRAPLSQGLDELAADAWITGVRRDQNWTREKADFIEIQDGRLKLQPIVDWTDQQIVDYMKENKLLNHPLWYEGFKRVGDVHTTEYPEGWQGIREASFPQRECTLHTKFAENEENGSGI